MLRLFGTGHEFDGCYRGRDDVEGGPTHGSFCNSKFGRKNFERGLRWVDDYIYLCVASVGEQCVIRAGTVVPRMRMLEKYGSSWKLCLGLLN